MTAKEFFEQQLITDANSVIDKTRQKYSRNDLIKFAEAYHQSKVKNLNIPCVSGSTFDWERFAMTLKDELGMKMISEDSDPNNPHTYWLRDVTVIDIVEFVKNYR